MCIRDSTKAGDATTMQKAATAARLMVIFLIFSLFVFILFFFSAPSEVTIFGRGETVSYTHLDVYKRQHCNGLRFKVLSAYEEFEGKKVENVF